MRKQGTLEFQVESRVEYSVGYLVESLGGDSIWGALIWRKLPHNPRRPFHSELHIFIPLPAQPLLGPRPGEVQNRFLS